MRKFNDIIKKIIFGLMIWFLSIIIFVSSFKNGIFLSILSIIIIYLFIDKIKIKNYLIFLFIFSLITKIISILIIHIPIKVDYLDMYNATLKMINNDFSVFKDKYFLQYNYQIFHVLYQSLIFKIFGKKVIILKILNCIYSSVICVLVYKISRKISSEKAARFTSLLYSISIYPLYLNSVLGNQQLSLMLMLIAVWIALENNNSLKYLIFSGYYLE